MFVRGLPDLCAKMKRPVKGSTSQGTGKPRKDSGPGEHPNFYKIDRFAPLPEAADTLVGTIVSHTSSRPGVGSRPQSPSTGSTSSLSTPEVASAASENLSPTLARHAGAHHAMAEPFSVRAFSSTDSLADLSGGILLDPEDPWGMQLAHTNLQASSTPTSQLLSLATPGANASLLSLTTPPREGAQHRMGQLTDEETRHSWTAGSTDTGLLDNSNSLSFADLHYITEQNKFFADLHRVTDQNKFLLGSTPSSQDQNKSLPGSKQEEAS